MVSRRRELLKTILATVNRYVNSVGVQISSTVTTILVNFRIFGSKVDSVGVKISSAVTTILVNFRIFGSKGEFGWCQDFVGCNDNSREFNVNLNSIGIAISSGRQSSIANNYRVDVQED